MPRETKGLVSSGELKVSGKDLLWPKIPCFLLEIYGLTLLTGHFLPEIQYIMNSKTLVFAVFVVWSAICWRWYVCGLMYACGPSSGPTSMEEVVAVPDDSFDTSTQIQTPEIQALGDKTASNKKAPGSDGKPYKPVSSSNMDEVQMEEVEDRMQIYFPYKSTRKEDNVAIEAYLSNLASQLISSGQKISITGHADFVGEPGDNYTFGLRRANGIRDILVKKGVPKSQIRCKSFGDRRPAATNDTAYGRYLNRRVVIQIVD